MKISDFSLEQMANSDTEYEVIILNCIC